MDNEGKITFKEDFPSLKWNFGIPDKLTLKCSLCKKEVIFDYRINDEIWKRFVPDEYRRGVICLRCLDEKILAKNNIELKNVLERVFYCKDNNRNTIMLFKKEDIQKHCLDKQKVKEVIDRYIELRKERIDQTNVLDFEQLKKELRLI